ncbi:MAG: hypothetical protein ACXWAC_10490 [Usitatibacter sp.]
MKTVLIAMAAAMALAACHEIPQDAPKPYAGKEDTKAYAGDRFKGDKQKYESTLADRANYQNEYIRTGEAKPK